MASTSPHRPQPSRRSVLAASFSTIALAGLSASAGPGSHGRDNRLPGTTPHAVPPPEPGEQTLGNPVTTTLVLTSAWTRRTDGQDVAVMVSTGRPAQLSAIDPRTGDRIGAVPFPGDAAQSVSVWAMATDPNTGTVVVGTTNGRAFLFNPDSLELDELPPPPGGSTTFFERAAPAVDSGFLFTTYPEARLYGYRPADRSWRDYGRLGRANDYAIGLAVSDGYAYVGTGTNDPAVHRVHLGDGSAQRIDLPIATAGVHRDFVYDIAVSGGLLFARVASERTLYVRDLASGRWIDSLNGVESGLVLGTGTDVGLYYAGTGFTVSRYDPATHSAQPVQGDYSVSQFRGGGWFDADGSARTVLGTVNTRGQILAWDRTNATARRISSEVEPSALAIRSIGVDPTGTIHVAGMGGGAAVGTYDPASGEFAKVALGGQVEAFGLVGGQLLAGTYPGAKVTAIGRQAEAIEGAAELGHEQDRPVAITEVAGGIAAIATIPVYGQRGGALSFVDPGGEIRVHRGIAPDQSPLCLAAAPDGRHVYVGTGSAAGLGVVETTDPGQVLHVHIRTGEVVGSAVPVRADVNVSALAFDADAGLWGWTLDTVFLLDPGTLKVLRSQRYSGAREDGRYFRGRSLVVTGDELVGCSGGSIFRINKATLKRTDLAEGINMVRAPDGYLYYSRGAQLLRWWPGD